MPSAPSFALLLLLLPLAVGCRRQSTAAPEGPAASGAGREESPAAAPNESGGTVGPLGPRCFDTSHAEPCPADATDPSGHGLPAYGSVCHIPLCRPCGSDKAPAFRDLEGKPSAGYCICVPYSDDSAKGTFTCYTPEGWKKRPQ